MLDLCLKVIRAGRRVVFDPGVVARKKDRRADLLIDGVNALLYEKWEDTLKEGDPFYNRNLPMGFENYRFYG